LAAHRNCVDLVFGAVQLGSLHTESFREVDVLATTGSELYVQGGSCDVCRASVGEGVVP
jgi:hypothetical protein